MNKFDEERKELLRYAKTFRKTRLYNMMNLRQGIEFYELLKHYNITEEDLK